MKYAKQILYEVRLLFSYSVFVDCDFAIEASRFVYWPSRATKGNSAVRPSRNREDDACQSRRDGVERVFLQYFLLHVDKQMGGREWENRSRAVPVGIILGMEERVAYRNQPSILFIDEIDSILTARSENENESSRRLKTEFIIQLDGASTTG